MDDAFSYVTSKYARKCKKKHLKPKVLHRKNCRDFKRNKILSNSQNYQYIINEIKYDLSMDPDYSINDIVPYSVNSIHYKTNIREHLCRVCKQCSASKLKLIECQHCSEFLIKGDKYPLKKYYACDYCWDFYSFCNLKENEQTNRIHDQRLRVRLSCHFVECFLCGAVKSHRTESPAKQMHYMDCVMCIYHYTRNKTIQCNEDMKYIYICDACLLKNNYCQNQNGDRYQCRFGHCIICQCIVIDSYRFRLANSRYNRLISMKRFYENKAQFCDNCAYPCCNVHAICPKKENGILFATDDRTLCTKCTVPIEEQNLLKLVGKEATELLCDDINSIIVDFAIGLAFECCNEKCKNVIRFKHFVELRSEYFKNNRHHYRYDNDPRNSKTDMCYYYFVESQYVKRQESKDKCEQTYGRWLRIFCRYCKLRLSTCYCSNFDIDFKSRGDCYTYPICFNHAFCDGCGCNGGYGDKRCSDCDALLCAHCLRGDYYRINCGKCRSCYDKQTRQELYDLIIVCYVQEAVVVNVILDFVIGYVFQCGCCEKVIRINNMNEQINDLIVKTDCNGITFDYYEVEEKYINEKNISSFSFVDATTGYIRAFCHECCEANTFRKCIYCQHRGNRLYTDNMSKDAYCICYNHTAVEYYKCGDCGLFCYKIEEAKDAMMMTENCEFCGKDLCVQCRDKYEHFISCYYSQEMCFEINQDLIMNNKMIGINVKKIRKRRNGSNRKIQKNTSYWKRKIDKRRNKMRCNKWNKQYLLSLEY